MRRSHGFTLLELLIAAGISVAVTAALVLLLHRAFAGAEAIARHGHGYALAEDLSDKWDAEAASAFAIFIPASDVLGAGNGDGHEVDFFTRDGLGRPFFWAYRYDAALHTLQRYTYALPGSLATPSGDALTGVTSFAAASVAVDGFSEPVFQSHANTPVTVRLGYPGVSGGNRVTELHLVTVDDDITTDLLPGIAPSGFTVVVGTFTPAPL
ncbi:MAG: prepilin-type N-terminal cleavage/methylation domain-containing protein, partial [bacterium]|nr:prepilin-type N-terminal cleavage/methylation domain-containing protein [bacterium]